MHCMKEEWKKMNGNNCPWKRQCGRKEEPKEETKFEKKEEKKEE